MISTLRNSSSSLVRKVRGSSNTTVVRIRLLSSNSNNRGRIIRDQDKANSNSTQPQESPQELQNNERAAVSALRREAQLEHSFAYRWNNDPLREEAELTQVIADLLEQDRAKVNATLTAQNRQQRQKGNTSAQNNAKAQQPPRANGQQQSRAQQQIPEFSHQASGREGAFKSAFELKMDAAVKQSIASRTHDQKLMSEAKFEQSIADSLSPNVGGQPLYGTGPGGKHHNRNSRQAEQNGIQQPVQNVEQLEQQPAQQSAQQQELPQNRQYSYVQENNFQAMQNFKRSDDLWEHIIVEFSDEVSRGASDQRTHDNAKYERWL